MNEAKVPGRPIGSAKALKEVNQALFTKMKNEICSTWYDKTTRPKMYSTCRLY
jgi:hypothetical protein